MTTGFRRTNRRRDGRYTPRRRVCQFCEGKVDSADYKDIKNSEVIIITAGVPRKPGMSRDDLLGINLKIIKQVADGIAQTSPKAFVICITNPLDVIVMALQKYSKFSPQKVVGMAGILDTSRFKYFLSQELKVPVKNIEALANPEAINQYKNLKELNY